MITLTSIEMFNLLKDKVGEKEAQALTEYISIQVKEGIQSEKQHLATKEDLVREVGLVRKEIAEAKTDMIKWFFAFFVSLALMIVGLYLKS